MPERVSTNEQLSEELQKMLEIINQLNEDKLVEIVYIILQYVTTKSALAEIEAAVVDRWQEID